ncbi:MAG: YraN family protein [Coriobacteriales bacterium]|nr:YraN family protein [Coriobacteriales bacterium]
MAESNQEAPARDSRDCSMERLEIEQYPRVSKKPIRTYSKREVGIQGELIAAHSCELRGYELLDRNWHCRWGEADIIALEGDTLVLIEVKTRIDFGGEKGVEPEVSVDASKLGRYRSISLAYLIEHPQYFAIRFDVIAVTIVDENQASLHHLVNVYCWED